MPDLLSQLLEDKRTPLNDTLSTFCFSDGFHTGYIIGDRFIVFTSWDVISVTI
jgi:hypothetical protein